MKRGDLVYFAELNKSGVVVETTGKECLVEWVSGARTWVLKTALEKLKPN